MKTTNVLFRLFFSIFFIFLTNEAIAAENLDSVVAVVNNGVITQSELSVGIAQARQQLAASSTPNAVSDDQLRQMVMQQLIDQKLQLQLAAQAHMTVSDEKVMQTIAKIAEQNHITLDALKSKLQQQGVSYRKYKKNIHDQLLIQQVAQSAVGGQIHIKPADLQNALEQYRARTSSQQMLHVIDINMPTQQEAQKIAVQLKNGGNPEKIAPNNTKDLGWQNENTLPTLFLRQLSHMSPGDIAGPIQAPNGFHVLKLVGERGNQSQSLTKTQLQNIAYQIKIQDAVEKWLKTVRKTAYIKITAP